MNKITLQEIIKSDIDGLNELVKLIEANYTHKAFPFTIEKALNPSTVYFKAFYNEAFIGVTGLEIKTPYLAETIKTVIRSEFRGKRLGSELSQAIEDECRARGIKKIISTIYTDNHAMIAIKLKQGYTIEGHHPDHEAPGFHEYSLGKILR